MSIAAAYLLLWFISTLSPALLSCRSNAITVKKQTTTTTMLKTSESEMQENSTKNCVLCCTMFAMATAACQWPFTFTEIFIYQFNRRSLLTHTSLVHTHTKRWKSFECCFTLYQLIQYRPMKIDCKYLDIEFRIYIPMHTNKQIQARPFALGTQSSNIVPAKNTNVQHTTRLMHTNCTSELALCKIAYKLSA